MNAIRWLCYAMALLCTSACAEGASQIPKEAIVPENKVVEIDLNGDGTMEKVSWENIREGESIERCVVTVTPANGSALTYEPAFQYALGMYAADLDGDGRTELLISGDEASSDYVTVCLHLFNGRLEPAMFADCGRTDYNRGYNKLGYGMVTAIEGNHLTLTGSQDILGTWFGSRVFALEDTGIFEFADDGRWLRDPVDLNKANWENQCMTTLKELSYMTSEGKEAKLPEGSKLMITASDKHTADFITADGIQGKLEVSPDEDKGWGSLVNGEAEGQVFDRVLYAD